MTNRFIAIASLAIVACFGTTSPGEEDFTYDTGYSTPFCAPFRKYAAP